MLQFKVCDGVVYVGSEDGVRGLGLYDHERACELARTHDWYELSKAIDALDAQGKGNTIERETYMQAYWMRSDADDEAYREENEDKLWAYYEAHKDEPRSAENEETWWDFFSDWHKDVYGVRPHFLSL